MPGRVGAPAKGPPTPGPRSRLPPRRCQATSAAGASSLGSIEGALKLLHEVSSAPERELAPSPSPNQRKLCQSIGRPEVSVGGQGAGPSDKPTGPPVQCSSTGMGSSYRRAPHVLGNQEKPWISLKRRQIFSSGRGRLNAPSTASGRLHSPNVGSGRLSSSCGLVLVTRGHLLSGPSSSSR